MPARDFMHAFWTVSFWNWIRKDRDSLQEKNYTLLGCYEYISPYSFFIIFFSILCIYHHRCYNLSFCIRSVTPLRIKMLMKVTNYVSFLAFFSKNKRKSWKNEIKNGNSWVFFFFLFKSATSRRKKEELHFPYLWV